MTRPLCSVVLATLDRGHLLKRSLWCYSKQDFDNDRFELVVIDDHSHDGTRDLVLDWSRTTGIRATVLTTAPKPQAWRDCGAVLNAGIRASAGDHILLTHPEVMPGRLSVQACVDALEKFELRRPTGDKRHWDEQQRSIDWKANRPSPDWVYPIGLYACCPVYYLSPQDQDRIDSVPWRVYGAGAVRDIEGFYTDDANGHPDFRHAVADAIGKPTCHVKEWQSFVFGGHSRETWRRLGGLMETQRWGAVDVAWMMRRHHLGIPNHTCAGPDCVVVHQNHAGTDRDEAKWRKELEGVNWQDRAALVHPTIDFLGW